MVELITDRRRKRKASDGIERWTFNHGLGDALMLRSALEHCPRPIRLRIPEECRYHRLFDDLPHIEVRTDVEPGYRYPHMRFYAEDYPFSTVSGPKTKPRICLEKELGIIDSSIVVRPRPLDMSHVSSPGTEGTEDRLSGLGDYAVVHVQGCSDRKNAPPLWLSYHLCKRVVEMGLGCVVINYDFDYRFGTTPDLWFIGVDGIQSTKSWPLGAESMWRVLRGSRGLVGIDSGPLHMALAISGLPCIHIKGRLAFKEVFYDDGLGQITAGIDQHSSFAEIDRALEILK